MVGSRPAVPSWLSAASRVEFDGGGGAGTDGGGSVPALGQGAVSDLHMGFAERAFSAAGAAVLSAVLVNPLDVAKVLFFVGSLCEPCHLLETFFWSVSVIGKWGASYKFATFFLLPA